MRAGAVTSSGLEDTRLFFGRGSARQVGRELRQGSPWAQGLWVVAVLLGILDAYRWHRGGGVFAYDAQHVWQAAHAVLHGRSSWNQFVYPPGCLLIAFPLAALPFTVTKVVVYALQFAGVAYMFWALTRLIRIPLGSVRIAWVAVLLALSGQLGVAAHFENFTLLLVPLAAAFFLAVDRERPMAAAVVLGVSLTVKPLLVPLLVVLLVARRWRASAVAVLIPVVLSALAMVVVVAVNADPSGFLHEVEHTFSANSGRPWNTSLSALVRYVHGPDALADAVRVVVVAVSLFACWRIWKHPSARAGEQAVWLTAPLFAILILCFSFAWGYYALLLLPLGFVSLRRDRVADWMVRVGVFVAIAPPLLVFTLPGYPDRYFQDGFSGHGILGLGIALDGATALGVLVTLAAALVHSYQGAVLRPSAASSDEIPHRETQRA